MHCESKSWRPAHWSTFKRRVLERDVWRHAEWQLCHFLGSYEAGKIAALWRAQRGAKESLAALRERGVLTLGEVGS